MDNVINLFAEREKRTSEPEHDDFEFSLHVYASKAGEASAHIFNADPGPMSEAENYRMMADRLEKLAVILHDKACSLQPDEDGFALARIKVFESSRVRAWYSDKIEGQESVEWMERRLDDAKTIISPSP